MEYKEYLRTQLSEEDWQRLQPLQLNLETRLWAEISSDFTNFYERRKTEIPFLEEQLKDYVKTQSSIRIFEACLGTGATTFGLRLSGFDSKRERRTWYDLVVNEIDENLIKEAMKNEERFGIGKVLGFNFPITRGDWRDNDYWTKLEEGFDGVLCLGNALTYIFKREEQIKTLKNFNRLLHKKGTLIIDERNYAEHFLAPNAKFKCSGKIIYCGTDKVKPRPIYISPSMIVMEYHHLQRDSKAHLVLYPFKKGEMLYLLGESGFKNIKVFGDYKNPFDAKEPEFITYVCKK